MSYCIIDQQVSLQVFFQWIFLCYHQQLHRVFCILDKTYLIDSWENVSTSMKLLSLRKLRGKLTKETSEEMARKSFTESILLLAFFQIPQEIPKWIRTQKNVQVFQLAVNLCTSASTVLCLLWKFLTTKQVILGILFKYKLFLPLETNEWLSEAQELPGFQVQLEKKVVKNLSLCV